MTDLNALADDLTVLAQSYQRRLRANHASDPHNPKLMVLRDAFADAAFAVEQAIFAANDL